MLVLNIMPTEIQRPYYYACRETSYACSNSVHAMRATWYLNYSGSGHQLKSVCSTFRLHFVPTDLVRRASIGRALLAASAVFG